ncbi:MAG: hypothetical protein ACOCR1_01775 [Planctomycetota bacterium]
MIASNNDNRRQLTKFGWQGISLTVPEQWGLVSTRGDYDSGFVALADEDTQRLQIKWEEGNNDSDPSEAANKYIRSLRKDYESDEQELQVNRRLNLATLPDKKVECYDWIGENRGTGMVSRCDDCHRMVHIVITGGPKESLRNLSRTVFASLQDHAIEERIHWKFYDIEFYSPAELALKRSELKTGCIRMQFRRKSQEIEFVRSSLAQMLLKKQSLKEWFTDFYADKLKRKSWDISAENLKGHEGLMLTGRPWLICDPWGIVGTRKKLRVACWHCQETNRIFVVGYGGRHNEHMLEDVVNSTVCCDEGNENGIV